MLSNVSKSADVLRGATEYQDLWADVEKETAVAGLKGPRVLKNAIMNGLMQQEEEERQVKERNSKLRRQHNNFYMSPGQEEALRARKSRMSNSERKDCMSRLAKRPEHTVVKPKSPTGLGHVCDDGSLAPSSPERSPKKVPKSKGGGEAISTPGTIVRTTKQRARGKFEGLTAREFLNKEWTPAFPYRPAEHESGPWKSLDGFAMSTRTLERRKLNPFLDINAYQGNKYSAKAQFASHAHVRPIDVKGQLGARAIQQWKETLREDFARDDDNFSSNAHDANLDALRAALGAGTSTSGGFSELA